MLRTTNIAASALRRVDDARMRVGGSWRRFRVLDEKRNGLPHDREGRAVSQQAQHHKNPEAVSRLDPEQYRVTQQDGTERPFTGAYWDNHEPGIVAVHPLR